MGIGAPLTFAKTVRKTCFVDPVRCCSSGVMAFHAGSGPSAMINMNEGNPIRISVQQGFEDPSISPDDALATQVSAAQWGAPLIARTQLSTEQGFQHKKAVTTKSS